MKKQLLLTGGHTAYRAENGAVELYAVRLADGNPHGQLHHFKTVDSGDAFKDYAPVVTQTGIWGCVAKCGGDAVPLPVGSMGDTDEFIQFTAVLEEEIEKTALLFHRRVDYAKRVLSTASDRLVKMKTKASKLSWEDFDDDNEYIKVCKVLCNYLKVEPKIPSHNAAENSENPSEEILYLSGVRYKKAALPDNWWKHNNGAMLATLDDGTPLALMPRTLYGYRAYDPKQNTCFNVDASFAARIKPEVTAVFRTLPSKQVRLSDIAGFILGENIGREIAVIVLCGLLAGTIKILPIFATAQIFDVIIPENLRGVLVEVIGVLIAFGLANIGFFITVNLGVARINTKAWLSIQAALWDRLLGLHISFFNKFTTGELFQKIKGIERIKSLISTENSQTVFSNLFFFINIIVMFYFSAKITLYVLPMFLVLTLVYCFACKKKYKLFKLYTDLENKSMSFNHQWVSGIHRIKTSCAEERVFNIWSVYETEKHDIKTRIKSIDNALGAFQMFFDLASLAVLYILVSQIHNVAMGMFVAYISTFILLSQSIKKLLKAFSVLPEIISIGLNIQPILDAIPEYSAVKAVPADMDGTLEVNHAVFRYEENGRIILNDISFRVEENESVGIIGLSGTGKSTLLKLLMGFYDLTSGKIYYGGYDIESIDLRYLRKQMGVVLQDGNLAVGDIYSNITGHDESVGYADVWDAVRNVGLEEMLTSLPDGLHTRLEHCPLSGEEKQRLLIARAIVKKHKFIFLDEAVSSLDSISQERILKNLKDIPATKIIIAQRMEAVKYCDKIIVVEHGGITQYDSYNEIYGSNDIPFSLAGPV